MQLQNPIPRTKKLVTNIITYGKRARFHTEQALLKIQPLAWNSMVYIRQTTPRSKRVCAINPPNEWRGGDILLRHTTTRR